MATRVADILHRSAVTVLAGVTVFGLVDIGFMHRGIMRKSSDFVAQQEMEALKQQREAESPFPQGTDLHPVESNQQPETRIA